MDVKHSIMIYVHIPFCVRKCRYCDFLSFDSRDSRSLWNPYVQTVKKELACRTGEADSRTVGSVYFGGGTPSLLPADCIRDILQVIRNCYPVTPDAEISLEANPGTITLEKADVWKEAGVTRVSLGAQSFSQELLELLGRIHTPRQIWDSLTFLRQAGFSHVSMDLMFGLPHQPQEQWEQTLQQAVSAGVEHLSCYSLMVEPGTAFARLYKEGEPPLPSEEEERQMYHTAIDFLDSQGLAQYEISNFARPGCESRHNSGYWQRIPYIGAGLGASSLTADQVRFHNTDSLKEYLSADADPVSVQREKIKLSRQDQMEEFMFLGLRMNRGISEKDFQQTFNTDLSSVYGPVLNKHTEEGLLIHENGSYRLSRRGMDLSNYVFADFLL